LQIKIYSCKIWRRITRASFKWTNAALTPMWQFWTDFTTWHFASRHFPSRNQAQSRMQIWPGQSSCLKCLARIMYVYKFWKLELFRISIKMKSFYLKLKKNFQAYSEWANNDRQEHVENFSCSFHLSCPAILVNLRWISNVFLKHCFIQIIFPFLINSLSYISFSNIKLFQLCCDFYKCIFWNYTYLLFKFSSKRIPIPDLRPIGMLDRPPWWMKNIRGDYLSINMHNVALSTVFSENTTKLGEVALKFSSGTGEYHVRLF